MLIAEKDKEGSRPILRIKRSEILHHIRYDLVSAKWRCILPWGPKTESPYRNQDHYMSKPSERVEPETSTSQLEESRKCHLGQSPMAEWLAWPCLIFEGTYKWTRNDTLPVPKSSSLSCFCASHKIWPV